MSGKGVYFAFGLLLCATAGAALGAEAGFIIDPHLIGWWPFEEGQGAVALDASGHGNHATLIGDPQWVPGYDGLALDFDGQDDYLDTGKRPSQLGIAGSAPRTVALWAYARSFNGGGLYEIGGHGDGEGLSLRTGTSDNEWRLEYGSRGDDFVVDSLNEWVHFTCVCADGDPVYVNGERVLWAWYRLATTDDVTFKIGVSGHAHFNGLIDDVRLYSRALASGEIARIMQGDSRRAWNPQPGHGSTVTLDQTGALHWSAGIEIVAHDVYLGREATLVKEGTIETDGVYRGRQLLEATSYVPPDAPLGWDATYYWRIDEVGDDGTITQGPLWRFTILEHLIVDDFESYDYDEDHYMWDTWIDGWVNGTGSTVGYLGVPFAEIPMPTHSGRQSMPFSYDNRTLPWYSEATRTWDAAHDWTRYDVDTLTLHFIGWPVPFFERADGTVVMGGRGQIGGTRDWLHFACKPLHGDGAIIVRVESLAEVAPGPKAGVMIRWDLEQGSPNVALLIAPGDGIVFQYRREKDGPTEQAAQAGPVPPYWVKLAREGGTITAECSPDGVNWGPVTDDPGASSVEMPTTRAFVGLAVANPGWYGTSAEFSGVSVVGSDAKNWQLADIAISYRGNDPDVMYVRLADGAGNVAVVNHPDPLAVGAATWQRWDIPLSEFATAGVDVTAIVQMIVGVGDRDNPVPNGIGTVHFDDFWLTRSTAPQPPDPTP